MTRRTITISTNDLKDALAYNKAVMNVHFYNYLYRTFDWSGPADYITLNWGPKREKVAARIVECAEERRRFLTDWNAMKTECGDNNAQLAARGRIHDRLNANA